MKKIITLLGVAFIAGIFLVIFNINNSFASDDKMEKNMGNVSKEIELEEQVTNLTIGGNSNPDNYLSNSYLYAAHIGSAAITHNTTFNNDGKPLGESDIKSLLEGIKSDLERIEYNEEREENIQKALHLTNKALEKNVELDDEIFKEIHSIIHDLDFKYNKNTSLDDIKVDETGVPVN